MTVMYQKNTDGWTYVKRAMTKCSHGTLQFKNRAPIAFDAYSSGLTKHKGVKVVICQADSGSIAIDLRRHTVSFPPEFQELMTASPTVGEIMMHNIRRINP